MSACGLLVSTFASRYIDQWRSKDARFNRRWRLKDARYNIGTLPYGTEKWPENRTGKCRLTRQKYGFEFVSGAL